jgi:ABC-type enterochelin transport system substrate-binding protein
MDTAVKEYLDKVEKSIQEKSMEELRELFGKRTDATKSYSFLENYINNFKEGNQMKSKKKIKK